MTVLIKYRHNPAEWRTSAMDLHNNTKQRHVNCMENLSMMSLARGNLVRINRPVIFILNYKSCRLDYTD